MTVVELQAICHTCPGATEDIKWDTHLCFCVGGKIFLSTSPDNFPVSAAFKVPGEAFDQLLARPEFTAHHYLSRHQWVHLGDIRRLTTAEWQHYIRQSYALIVAKLPAKIRQQLGG
ncbi:MmcQ/YjbR family DNA-binding protein [Hymenobacter lucidus]|uniref:MmcQ/YjbR family DNA-binding protein n=1 Tax=Hymenobacter lucidus TaxID=2880930 RepID=A0ABS8ARR8_9BACT|nr:MmcQ/YjbR family DNA-binding protein [Hymenobacter lucidus]MCB2408439.1 MmcQ/YjbR family DNA-binding protein [Hymenobacter lucidus]